MEKILLPVFAVLVLLTAPSCKKDKTKDYEVPTIYNFDSVDYSGQTTRLAMLVELSNEMKKGNTTGVAVSELTLLNMYANTNSPFANPSLNTSGKKLKDKTFATEQAKIESWLSAHATISLSTQAGSNGTAGVVTSGTKAYLFDENGVEYTQLVDKGLLGSLVYYQITAVYLGTDKMGTQVALADRLHHWDEAFGYFGVPTDFPTNKTGLLYIGKYGNDRDALLNCNATIMNAYLKGRAALSNDDETAVSEQIDIIRTQLERIVAGTAVHYINEALSNAADNAVRNHALSEGLAFVRALNFNPTKKITTTQLADLETLFGSNFYTVTTGNLQSIKTSLSTIYGFESIKDQL